MLEFGIFGFVIYLNVKFKCVRKTPDLEFEIFTFEPYPLLYLITD